MSSYIVNFATYTMAMVGFIVLAVFIYKKTMCIGPYQNNKDYLKIENALRLTASKTIYVLKAGSERFLIAGDSANTTMLAKLNEE